MDKRREPEWVEAMPLTVLEQAGRKIFKAGGKQIVLFHVDGKVHACNNRCPHEGYPLIEGTVDQAGGACRLTCNWHNWKFDLTTGEAMVGGDAVRLYPVKIEDGEVLVDLSDPAPGQRLPKILENLS